MSPSTTLIPIRIDVSSSDKSNRIVDTILFDPSVWPVPLEHHSPSAFSASLEANVQLLADQIINDAEVIGMGRTVRHFTGRVELWENAMQQQIANQLRTQLLPVALGRVKRKLPEDKATKEKRQKTDSAATAEVTEVLESKQQKMSTTNGDEDEKTSSQQTGESDDKKVESNEQAKHASSSTVSSLRLDHLLPIRIRLSTHGVRIHDDFYVDPLLPTSSSPLVLARAIGNDLNLADEAVMALAIDIAEQMYGLQIDDNDRHEEEDEDDDEGRKQVQQEEGGPEGDRSNTTAAWTLEQRVHITNVAHLVQQYRQSN